MKISDSKRSRREKKFKARQEREESQSGRHETKFRSLAETLATGGPEALKIDLRGIENTLRAAGKTAADLQTLVAEIQAERRRSEAS